MAKKKQPDFQPTKLRVGKHLPRGKNVTNTSFKSKKIITKEQNLKPVSETSSLTELIRLTHHTNVPAKIDAVKRLERYIEQNDSSLASYFSEILTPVGKILLDYHPKVRQEAIDLIKISIDLLSNTQMSSFVSTITSHLNCMMTHINISVKKDSLELLSAMLETHPNLICHSTNLLSNLLNMISSIKPQKKGESSLQKKRKLDDNISSTMLSVEWRDQVMKLIVKFLEKLVGSYAIQESIFHDEQKVYWDSKRPLFVQLYFRGGLCPAKLEFSPSLAKSGGDVTLELQQFFSHLVSVASDIVTEEVAASKPSSNGISLRLDNVERLNTVTQVLCCLADWYSLGSHNEDNVFISEINRILHKKLMKGFCYSLQDSVTKKPGRKNKELSCVHLNLGISYLYCSFILGTEFEDTETEKLTLAYVTDTLLHNTYAQDLKTISLVLIILKSFLKDIALFGSKMEYLKDLSNILNHFCEMLTKCKDKNMEKEIQSFFIKISLDFDYKFLLDCGALDFWIVYSFHQMKRMLTDKKVCYTMLKCINQMCIREYPAFNTILNDSVAMEIIGCLKLEDEEYQFTVLNLITHMTELPEDFLQNVAHLILTDSSLSVKLVAKLIRMLFDRFLDSRVNEEEFSEFTRFLLNLILDVESFEKFTNGDVGENVVCFQEGGEAEESNAEEGGGLQTSLHLSTLRKYLYQLQGKCNFYIFPTLIAERHSEITEVAIQCLLLYPDRDLVVHLTSQFFEELCIPKIVFPVHSVIGLFKLATGVFMFEGCMLPNVNVSVFIDHLLISSLYYISLLTISVMDSQLKMIGVVDLQNALCLTEENCYQALKLMSAIPYNIGIDIEWCFHTLRIMKCFIARQTILPRELIKFGRLLQTIEHYLAESPPGPELTLLHEIYGLIHS